MHKYFIIILAIAIATGCTSKTSTNNADHLAHNRAADSTDHNSMDHANMDHAAMKGSPGAASAPIELQFLDTMIVHHQGAIDMAKLAETRAERPEVKQLAADITRDQEREIAMMTEWRKKWFGEKAQAINMEFPGMSTGMRGMEIKRLESVRGNDFDVEFVRQMIPHHEGAIEMAKHIAAVDAYAELKTLANEMIKAQDVEIKQMREWSSAWSANK